MTKQFLYLRNSKLDWVVPITGGWPNISCLCVSELDWVLLITGGWQNNPCVCVSEIDWVVLMGGWPNISCVCVSKLDWVVPIMGEWPINSCVRVSKLSCSFLIIMVGMVIVVLGEAVLSHPFAISSFISRQESPFKLMAGLLEIKYVPFATVVIPKGGGWCFNVQ